VIPTYNGARFLGAALDSVRAQTFEDWELVVFDDGSDDSTLDVAERYAAADRRIRVCPGEHRGVAATRNRGFAATDDRSDFVIFLDMDDRWEPDALGSLVAALEANDSFVSAYGLLQCIDDTGHRIAGDDMAAELRARQRLDGGDVVPIPVDAPLTIDALAIGNWVVTPGTHLIRRSVAERVGGFDRAAVPADDWDLVIRISREGPIGFVDHIVLQWRRHDDAFSHHSGSGWRTAHYTVRRKMLLDPANTAEQRRAARAGYHHVVRTTVGEARKAMAAGELSTALRHVARAGECIARYTAATIRLAFDTTRRRIARRTV
jgi:glycosyltransferase involved in cell wall biosynthesis